jgi:hypothetical protein
MRDRVDGDSRAGRLAFRPKARLLRLLGRS